MSIHHGKHHAGYTAKLNAAIEGSDLAGKSMKPSSLISTARQKKSERRSATMAAASPTTACSGRS